MSVMIRDMRVADLEAVGKLAAALVRFHHESDAQRFFLTGGIEEGYRGYFKGELNNKNTILLMAELDNDVVGYAFGTLENKRNWSMLLDPHAALHDLSVAETARRTGVGEALVDAFVVRAKAAGFGKVVLYSAAKNENAQRLFARRGFRPTMVEMTRDE